MDGDRAARPLAEGRQPGVIGRDAPNLDGEEDILPLLLDDRLNLLQRRQLGLGRQVVFHLVEPHRPLGGEQLPALVDRRLRRRAAQQQAGDTLPHAVRPAKRVAQHLQRLEEGVVLAGRRGERRLVGLVMGDVGGQARERDGVELVVAVRFPALFRLADRLLERLDPHPPPQSSVGRGAQLDLCNDPQRPQRHPGGIEHLRPPFGVAFDRLAVGGDQGHGRDVAVQRRQADPRAVGRRRDGPGNRLLVDVRQVGHRPAPGSQRRSQRAQPGPSLDHGGVAFPTDDARQRIQRHQCAVGRRQSGEAVPCPDRPDRTHGGLQPRRQLALILGRQPLGRIGVLDTRPVAPQHPPLRVHRIGRGRLGLVPVGDHRRPAPCQHHAADPGRAHHDRLAPRDHHWAPDMNWISAS